MAESEDVSEKAEKKNINITSAMDTIDQTILHHLDKLDSTAKGDVLDSLMTDFEKDTLTECREVIFVYARGRYCETLKGTGVVDKPKLLLKRRNGEKACELLAKDIIELFVYATEMGDIFPKEVVSSTCLFVEIESDVQKKIKIMPTE